MVVVAPQPVVARSVNPEFAIEAAEFCRGDDPQRRAEQRLRAVNDTAGLVADGVS